MTTNIDILYYSSPIYRQVFKKGPNYNKALNRTKMTLFVAPEMTKPPMEGHMGVKDEYTRAE